MTFDVRKLDDPAKYERMVELATGDVWWDPAGPLGGLHLLNQVRVPYFERVLGGYAGKRILDVGCGGGVFAEAMARAGASVVAFDASPASVEAAIAHARGSGLEIDYRHGLAESFEPGERFDAVMAVDVLEHVADLDLSLDTCARALKPGGTFGFLTHNQTLEAFTELIWLGEYRVGFIPKGNHDFHKFIDPDDLTARMAARGLELGGLRGIAFDLDAPAAMLSDSTAVSYLGHATRTGA